MDSRGDGAGMRDGFFYPEGTVARAAARTRRPPRRGSGGPRLPWLLCALLSALMAAAGVWVVEPLRRQLAQAKAGQAAAVANVLQLRAEQQAALAATAPTSSPPVAADEGAAWAKARRKELEAALAEDVAKNAVNVRTRGACVEVVAARAPTGAGPEVATKRLFTAVAQALATDESPYRLTLFVPVAAAAAAPEPHHSARHRRRRNRNPAALLPPLTAEQAAAEAAAKLLIDLQASLAQRPKSAVEAAFGRPIEEGHPTTLTLRLARAVPSGEKG